MADHVRYICWGDDEALISPCSCRGTGGYVHKDCLRDSFRNRGDWLDLDCPQCKHPFYGQIGVDLATFAFWQVLREDGENLITFYMAVKNLAFAFKESGTI